MQTRTNRNSSKAERRKPRFSGVTSGIRLRPEQDEAIEKVLVVEPELDKSKIIRQGVDLWLRSYQNQNQPRVLQSLSRAP